MTDFAFMVMFTRGPQPEMSDVEAYDALLDLANSVDWHDEVRSPEALLD